eukprot:991885-Amphidinium_carterae.1
MRYSSCHVSCWWPLSGSYVGALFTERTTGTLIIAGCVHCLHLLLSSFPLWPYWAGSKLASGEKCLALAACDACPCSTDYCTHIKTTQEIGKVIS